jgi:N-acetylglucosaminyl-diphospho-decaprenol L-rhamnosyltransferase
VSYVPRVSLILVTYDSSPLLPAFFDALASTRYPDYEVVVVDNASRDGTLAYLADEQPTARVIANTTNCGFGSACNQGARIASGDVFVFLNPDVLVTRDWLSILVRRLSEQPDIGIICPTTLYPGEAPGTVASSVEEVAAVPGCAMMMPRRVWEALGGFDEAIFLYWEDTELCWRAWLLGWRVAADLEAHVYHERGGSTRGRRWDVELTRNGLYTYLKLMRWRRVVPFVMLLAVKTVAKAVLHRDRHMLSAWISNMRRLGPTLRARAAFRARITGDAGMLEQRIRTQARRLRREREQRRRGVPWRLRFGTARRHVGRIGVVVRRLYDRGEEDRSRP